MSNSDNEVDLLQLLADTIALIKNSKLIIVSLTALGLVYGMYQFVSGMGKSRYNYQKTLIVQSNIIQNPILIEVVNSIGNNISSSSVNTDLAALMEMPSESLAKIKSITALQNSMNNVDVIVESYDVSILDSMPRYLKHYVESNEYIKTQLNYSQTHNKEYLQIIKNLISQYENNQKLNKEFYNKNEEIIKELTGSRMENWSTEELLKQKAIFEKDLNFSKEIDFIVTNNPVETIDSYRQLFKKIIGFTLLGTFVGIVFSFLYHFYKKATQLIVKKV